MLALLLASGSSRTVSCLRVIHGDSLGAGGQVLHIEVDEDSLTEFGHIEKVLSFVLIGWRRVGYVCPRYCYWLCLWLSVDCSRLSFRVRTQR